MKDLWAVVPGWDGKYEVSSRGQVRALFSTKRWGRYYFDSLRPLATVEKDGYPRVTLVHEGRRRTVGVHTLVAEAFLPLPEPGETHVDHIDFDRKNNCVENLQWVMPTANVLLMHAAGRSARGLQLSQSVLDEEVVADCRARFRSGASVRELADSTGTSWHTMRSALTGATWSGVPNPIPLEEIPPREYKRGFEDKKSKLTLEQGQEILRRRLAGERKSHLARAFGVDRGTIDNVLKRLGKR